MADVGGVVVDRDVVRIEGPDAATYLQGQLSQDVLGLEVDASAWTFVLQPQGKVDAWFRITRVDDEAFDADMDAGSGEQVLARLQRFLLRTKAELSLTTVPMVAVRGGLVPTPDGARALDPAWPGIDGVDLLGTDELPAGVDAWTVDDLERTRIESGVPAMGSELTDATIPAEAGIVERSVSFTKGCFTGQELVARIDSRGGNVPRHLRGLVADGELPVGADVVVDGKVVGKVTSSVADRALAYIGRAVEPPTDATVDGQPVEIVALPDVTYLDGIVAAHRERAAADTRSTADLLEAARATPAPRPFREALAATTGVALIAEVKRRSPSKGDLAPGLDPATVARQYEAGGAACLSVLTDEAHFGGSADDLAAARSAVGLPALRKDFTVSEADVCDARLMGADAVLLIVAALDDAELKDFAQLAVELDLAALVEVHDEPEVDRALAAGADLVGVNQRDLMTFSVDTNRAVDLAGRLPAGVVRVAESGITGPEDVLVLADAGYDAILVGETLVTAPDPSVAAASLVAAGTGHHPPAGEG